MLFNFLGDHLTASIIQCGLNFLNGLEWNYCVNSEGIILNGIERNGLESSVFIRSSSGDGNGILDDNLMDSNGIGLDGMDSGIIVDAEKPLETWHCRAPIRWVFSWASGDEIANRVHRFLSFHMADLWHLRHCH